MSETSVPSSFSDLRLGMKARTEIIVREEDMDAFAEISGDRSSVHVDPEFAEKAGFSGRVVYGGLMVAALSRMVGMTLPGPIGVAAGWKIDFPQPLYMNEPAVLEAEISQISESVRLVKLKFTISAGERMIAKGSAEAKIIA